MKKPVVPEQPENSKTKRDYTNEASVRIVNMILDPDERSLLSLSRINSSRECLLLSIQIAKEAAMDEEICKQNIPISKVWREAFLLLRRSLDSKTLSLSFGLAHEQAVSESEAAAEEVEL